MELKDYINEFKQIVDQIYGTYLDSMGGFELNIKQLKIARENFDKSHSHGSIAMLRVYPPHKGGKYAYHSAQAEEILSRNAPQGRNSILIANLCLVAIYQYWEDRYRLLIAQSLHVSKNEIQVPLFGDIKFLRDSIIHHRGIAIPRVDRCKILNWFKKGEPIQIMKVMFVQLIEEVLDCLHKMEINPEQFIISN